MFKNKLGPTGIYYAIVVKKIFKNCLDYYSFQL